METNTQLRCIDDSHHLRFAVAPVYSDASLAIRGVEIDAPDARFEIYSTEHLPASLFDKFHWTISVDRLAKDAVGNNLSWLIFTRKGMDTVTSMPNLASEFIRVPDRILRQARRYCEAWVFHPMKIVHALDQDHSEISWVGSGRNRYVGSLGEIVLKREALINVPAVFRLGDYMPTIIVDETFRRVWEGQGCTGLDFEPIRLV